MITETRRTPETVHDGETLAQALDRLGDNLEDPFDKHAKSRGRYGWWDLVAGHAVTNVFVTRARELPRLAGHRETYKTIALAVSVVVNAIFAFAWWL